MMSSCAQEQGSRNLPFASRIRYSSATLQGDVTWWRHIATVNGGVTRRRYMAMLHGCVTWRRTWRRCMETLHGDITWRRNMATLIDWLAYMVLNQIGQPTRTRHPWPLADIFVSQRHVHAFSLHDTTLLKNWSRFCALSWIMEAEKSCKYVTLNASNKTHSQPSPL